MTDPEPVLEEREFNRSVQMWRRPDGTLHRDDGPAHLEFYKGELQSECWVQDGQLMRPDGGPSVVEHTLFSPGREAQPTEMVRHETWAAGAFEEPIRARRWMHRTDGPASISYGRNGVVRIETWATNQKLHRVGGPAEVRYDQHGTVVEERWLVDGEPTAGPDGWTRREYHPNGQLKLQLSLPASGLHRSDGPAYLSWFADGSPETVEYWQDGVMSRLDGPAAVEYFEAAAANADEGQRRCEQWRVDDRLHRVDGPAVTIWHQNGQLAEHQWWVDGKRRSAAAGPAVEKWSEDGQQTAAVEWSEETGAMEGQPYLEISYVENVPRFEDATLRLRQWHRWFLGLEAAPDCAPFTSSDWLGLAKSAELRSRLAYLPAGDAIAQRVEQWRAWEEVDLDAEATARAFVQFVREQAEAADIAIRKDLLDLALAGEVTFSDTPPEAGPGEYKVRELNDITDEINSVPYVLHESIYNASGNWFHPIYWITEPLHGFDLSPWIDFERAKLGAVVKPTGIEIGPHR